MRLLSVMNRRVPVVHPNGWDFEDVAEDVVWSANDLQRLCVAMDWWDDMVDEEIYHNNEKSG